MSLKRFATALLFCCLLVTSSCKPYKAYEIDYKWTVLKKAPDGTYQDLTREAAHAWGETWGERSGFEHPSGWIWEHVLDIKKDSAVIEFTYPDGTTDTVTIGPRETKEQLQTNGDYGVRVTLEVIRKR
ncbi:MAG TPA: hypothetical protein VF131_08965 [Blastocatellia bacterium]|nr:hypothetical protein [Blastocatellia bacterium]